MLTTVVGDRSFPELRLLSLTWADQRQPIGYLGNGILLTPLAFKLPAGIGYKVLLVGNLALGTQPEVAFSSRRST